MSTTSDCIGIIWKTTCKRRDTDYFVKRKDVKPVNLANNDDWTTVPLKEGDAVKVKYASRWYNPEIVEFVNDEKNEGLFCYIH